MRAIRQAIDSPSLHAKLMTSNGKYPSCARSRWAAKLKSILIWISAYFFGCIHRHTTWPHHHAAGYDYVCCLDCGKELPYSCRRMRIVTREEILQERNHAQREQVGSIPCPPPLAFSGKDG